MKAGRRRDEKKSEKKKTLHISAMYRKTTLKVRQAARISSKSNAFNAFCAEDGLEQCSKVARWAC